MVIRSNVIGVQVQDITRSGSRSSPFGKCLILGSALTGADRTQTTITSLENFDLLFGATSPSRKYVESFFLEFINAGIESANIDIELIFYKVNIGTTTATVTDYTLALNTINPLASSGGILIAPELYETLPIANRKAFFDSAETFCNFDRGSLWIHLVDINPAGTTYTEADVASEKTTNYNSAMSGFSYYGIGQRSINNSLVSMMPSASIAAYFFNVWQGSNFFKVPSDYSKSLKSFTSLLRDFRSVDTMINSGVNPIVKDDNIYPFSAVSGTLRSAFKHINSVVCYKLSAFYLAQALRPYTNYSVSGDEDLPSKVKATLESEAFTCYRNRKLLTGQSFEDAFKVTVSTAANSPNIGESIEALVELRPSYTNQRVLIKFVNLLGLTA